MSMVDVGFIAGTPRDCIEPLEEMCAYAQEFGFDQICLAKLGPDYEEAITVLCARSVAAAIGAAVDRYGNAAFAIELTP